MQTIDNVIDYIEKFKKFDDGTYDPYTGGVIEYSLGYQVSFVRPEAFKQLSRQDWDVITNHLCSYLDSVAHIGVYDGGAEVSFHSILKEKALNVMEKYNQESILDWACKTNYPESIESWFIVNYSFDSDKEVNYVEVLKEIQ